MRGRENFWETLDEIEPGALSRLYRLVCDRRWELIFLTSRPETAGDTAQAQSHRWLAAHGFPAPSVFVVHGSRGRIAAALNLDVLVDDRPENCLDVAIDSSARAILVWRGDEEQGAGQRAAVGDWQRDINPRLPRHPRTSGRIGIGRAGHGQSAQAAPRPEASRGAAPRTRVAARVLRRHAPSCPTASRLCADPARLLLLLPPPSPSSSGFPASAHFCLQSPPASTDNRVESDSIRL